MKKPIPNDFKRRHQNLLTGVGGSWYLDNINKTEKLDKRSTLNNRLREEHNRIKGKLKVSGDH